MKAMILEKFGGPEILQYMNVPDPLAGPPGHVRGKIVLEVSR